MREQSHLQADRELKLIVEHGLSNLEVQFVLVIGHRGTVELLL